MNENNSWLLGLVIFYILGFYFLGQLFNRGFFKLNPQEDISLDRLVEHTERQKTTSFTLGGFALTALTFIIAIFSDKLASVEYIIGFFGMGFIFEIISAFFYQNLTKNHYSYLGMIFQYGGMFSVFVGFWSYALSFMQWSLLIQVIFSSGLIAFIVLTTTELKHYMEYWRNRTNE